MKAIQIILIENIHHGSKKKAINNDLNCCSSAFCEDNEFSLMKRGKSSSNKICRRCNKKFHEDCGITLSTFLKLKHSKSKNLDKKTLAFCNLCMATTAADKLLRDYCLQNNFEKPNREEENSFLNKSSNFLSEKASVWEPWAEEYAHFGDSGPGTSQSGEAALPVPAEAPAVALKTATAGPLLRAALTQATAPVATAEATPSQAAEAPPSHVALTQEEAPVVTPGQTGGENAAPKQPAAEAQQPPSSLTVVAKAPLDMPPPQGGDVAPSKSVAAAHQPPAVSTVVTEALACVTVSGWRFSARFTCSCGGAPAP